MHGHDVLLEVHALLGCIFPIGYSVLGTLNSNFAILNTRIFSIRVKELFEPIVLRQKGDGFLLFLKAFSWETNLWVILGSFTVKKRKIGKGNLYLTENQWSWNKICCAADNHNNMCHTCAKEFLDLNFNYAIIDKISNCPKFHIFT